MSILKKLAGQTALYGLPSIVGRALNYLLVPIHTYFFQPEAYGIISEFYAYVAFFVVLLVMGMETTFFRFVNNVASKEQHLKIFNQGLTIILMVNLVFLVSVISYSSAIAAWMGYPEFGHYVIWFAFILSADSISALFFAKLRYKQKAKQFAVIQFASIGVNILLNLILLYSFVPKGSGIDGIGYIFLANLCASLVKPALMYKDVITYRFNWNTELAKKMLFYAFPLVIAGFAGIINETFDRILIKRLLMGEGVEYAQAQVGIYSANYKLAVLISLFIQAYRYAAEPFFFEQAKSDDSKKIYSQVMTYFVIVVSFLFLIISLNLSLFKFFIPNEAYWEGLTVVPILLLAYVFLGIYYNQSIWYKLADKTKYGAYIAVGGAALTLIMNFTLIPLLGYVGAAITTFSTYLGMMIASYYLGKKHYPIKYNLRKIALYLISALVFFGLSRLIVPDQMHFSVGTFIMNLIFLALFTGIVLFIERPFQRLRAK